MEPRIYVDLDDCLIHSLHVFAGACDVHRKIVKVDDGSAYASCIRPGAIDLLAQCRSIATTLLLTTATTAYAAAHNAKFRLGFAHDEIIAREQYLDRIRGAYGASSSIVTSINVAPRSVLIDNMAPLDEYAQLKMMHLGIRRDRYFQISEFSGEEDFLPPPDETSLILDKIRRILDSQRD